jgi:putative membrane protein
MDRLGCLALPAMLVLAAASVASAQALADPGRSADATFLAKASEATALDVELATLAATRGKSTAIKAFARQVVEAGTALGRELTAMARARQIELAPAADLVEPEAASLAAAPRGAFDAAFVTAMIARREAAVALFEAESRDGRDDEVKEWAARQLPALREHLAAVRALRPGPRS